MKRCQRCRLEKDVSAFGQPDGPSAWQPDPGGDPLFERRIEANRTPPTEAELIYLRKRAAEIADLAGIP